MNWRLAAHCPRLGGGWGCKNWDARAVQAVSELRDSLHGLAALRQFELIGHNVLPP